MSEKKEELQKSEENQIQEEKTASPEEKSGQEESDVSGELKTESGESAKESATDVSKESAPIEKDDSLYSEAQPEGGSGELKVESEESATDSSEEKTSIKEETSEEHHDEHYEFSEEEEEEEEEIDYDKLSKEELLDKIKEVTGKDISKISEQVIENLKQAFYHIVDAEKEAALEEFLKEEGNTEEDFDYHKNKDLIQQFQTYYHGFKDQKRKHHSDLSQQKEDNLKKKHDLLERLRQFVDEEEDNVSVKTLKEIEEEWKAAEPIPNNFNRELWANFNALRDRFYDKRSIFFELKELDRKKNQKLKEEIIEKAKELLTMDPVNAAVTELKKLHEEYKHIGSVPNEIRPALWEEFKKVSDQIHERKQQVSAEFKKKLDENLELKKEMIKKLETYLEFTSDKIAEWNEKSREIMNIQDKWKNTGPVPRELSKEISKTFWSNFKGFFKNKQQFFKQLDEKREKNYEDKEKLCIEVEEIIKSEDEPQASINRVKELQRKWKEIGPAPRKKSEAVYKRFKSACDEFFDGLRGHRKEMEKEYEVNLVKKNEIADKIKAVKEFTEDKAEEVEAMIKEWLEAGFVPRKAIKSSKQAITDAVDQVLKNAKDIEDGKLEMLGTKFRALLMKVDFHGTRNIRGQIDKLRKQIQRIEDNTSTLKTNMEFFASTKNAEKLKDDVQRKIDKAEQEIVDLKNKIKLLRQIDD